MIQNTQTLPPIVHITVCNVGEAIRVIRNARAFCLSASYHPLGGEACNQVVTTPVTHTVWVMGKSADLIEFLKAGA